MNLGIGIYYDEKWRIPLLAAVRELNYAFGRATGHGRICRQRACRA